MQIVFENKINGILADVTSAFLSDMAAAYGVKRNDTGAVVVADETAMTHTSTGIYTSTFIEPEAGLDYTYSVEYTFGGITYFKTGIISDNSDLSDLEKTTANVLEDPNNVVFSPAIVEQCINQALMIASHYRPGESRETVTLAAGSTEVDVSGIPGLLRVLSAEYKTNQKPKQFRNVSRFGDTITIETDMMPLANEAAYLYCERLQTPWTLPLELRPIVYDLAAGYAAMNHVGDGRTQIDAAIADLTTIDSTISGVSALIGNAAIALGNITDKLSDAANNLSASAGETSAMTMGFGAQISGIAAALERAEGDLAATRNKILSGDTDAAAAIAATASRISRAIDDLQIGRDNYIGEITNGLAPDSQIRATGATELQIAQTQLAQARSDLLLANSGLGFLGSASQEANLATINERIARLYQMNGQAASEYNAQAGNNLRAAGVYVSESAIILKQANMAITQSVSQMKRLASRLDIAAIIANYQR